MKFFTPKTAVALASTLVLTACGGSSTVSNNGGFQNYEDFAGLILEPDAEQAFDAFELVNSGTLLNSNPATNAFFSVENGAVFRESGTSNVYVGDFGAVFNGSGMLVTIDNIAPEGGGSVVAGDFAIGVNTVVNGEFNGTLTGADGIFDGMTAALNGAYVNYAGDDWVIVEYQGDIDGVATGICSANC